MSYKSSPFKMAPKSPAMKALKGEQVNEASPAKQTKTPKGERNLGEGGLKGTTFNQATKIVNEVKSRQDAGQRSRSVSTGMGGVDEGLADNEGYIDRARARAGGGYYKKPGMREAEENRRMTQRVKIKQANDTMIQKMKNKSRLNTQDLKHKSRWYPGM